MNCPGQDATSPFFFTLAGGTQWLNPSRYASNNGQFKCYDGMHAFNQVQPAPYDGMYQFPSVTARNPQTGKPAGTNFTICVPDPDSADPYYGGIYRCCQRATTSLKWSSPRAAAPGGRRHKNILIGDNYIAPAVQQFGGLGSIFILPDQAAVEERTTPMTRKMRLPIWVCNRTGRRHGQCRAFWPCVGQARVVPDYISLFPGSAEVAPFAGATRNLCDRKGVILEDQSSVLAKFYVFSSTHVAAHYSGIAPPTTSPPSSTRLRRHSEKSSPCRTCRSPIRTSTAWRFLARIAISGDSSTA